MGWLTNSAGWLEKRISRRRAPIVGAINGTRGWSQYGIANAAEAVRHYRSWVYIAIDAVSRGCSQDMPRVARKTDAPIRKTLSPKVVRKSLSHRVRKSHDDQESYEYLDESDRLVQLLNNPNGPDVSCTFWQRFWMFVELTGIGYIYKDRDGDGMVQGLWVLPTQWVRAIPDDTGEGDGIAKGYQLTGFAVNSAADENIIPPEDIIAFRYPSPFSMIDGVGRTLACGAIIDTNESAEAARVLALKNGGNVGNVITIPGADENTIARFEQRFRQKYTGETTFNVPLILPEECTFTPNATPQEIALSASAEQLRKMVLGIWGVPEIVVGFTEATNYATSVSALRQFAHNVINPRLKMLGQLLTEHLAPEFEEGVEIFWEDQSPNDREMELKEIQVASAIPGVVAPNDVRRWMGWEPWEDPTMDLPIMGVGNVPMQDSPNMGGPRNRGDAPNLMEQLQRLDSFRAA